ncbi:MAG: GLPGLI family protein [Flavobacteriaceae bacterium]|jgi:GLPGLI family protein
MKNYNSFLLLSLVTFSLFAQDFQGKAYYMSKSKINPEFGKNIPPERKKRIMERMKSDMEKTYVLDFNSTVSLFYEEERLDVSGGNGRFNFMSFMNPIQGVIHKEYATKTFTNRVELFGKYFLIKDTLPESKWVLSGESKNIGQYLAYKATLTREIPQEVFQFGRQSDNDSGQKPKMKKVNITAWFSPQIPVSTGPAKHGGLPGLILEVSTDNTTMLCTKVVMNPKEKIKIKELKKGTKVGLEEYEKIRKDKIEEMREMFQKNRRQGGGNFRAR